VASSFGYFVVVANTFYPIWWPFHNDLCPFLLRFYATTRYSQYPELLNVKTKHKFQILLVIVICFLLPLLSAYLDYYVLTEADFFSVHPKFENTDLECLSLCKKQDLIALTAFSHPFKVADNLIGHLRCFSYQVTFSQVNDLVLRC